MAYKNSPVVEIVNDMVRRSLYLFPVGAVAGLLLDGWIGSVSILIGLFVIVANFIISAYLMAWTVHNAIRLLASMTIGGFFIRMSSIAAVIWLCKDVTWINIILLSFTIVIAHVGLLFWELQFISKTITQPGLKPKAVGFQPAAGYEKRSRSGVRT